jgi:hypothetical protein
MSAAAASQLGWYARRADMVHDEKYANRIAGHLRSSWPENPCFSAALMGEESVI